MNKYLKIIILSVFVLMLPSSLLAAGAKIGFVNPIVLLDKAPQTKAAKEKVEKEFKSRDNQLVKAQKGLRKEEEKLKKDGTTMSSSSRQKLESKISRLKRELKRDLTDFREDFSIARNREMSKLQKRINEAIVKLAKDEKFDLIVGDSVVYASDRIDITEKVLVILRAKFKKNAGK
ncbi:MAG: OmpH family outer membrane protein [Gammaproteobacteria bacterium]|nr:MAG: OmpH family outer membrane protein [Gammaproteobacteria bacterium]